MNPGHIVVSGNIGVGKSSMVQPLAEGLGVRVEAEQPEHNPWFNLAFENPRRWSFAAETCFAIESALASARLASGGVQERFPDEHVRVFGMHRHAVGSITDEELQLLEQLLFLIRRRCSAPDVIIWLRAPSSALLGRIRERGRSQEARTTLSELDALERLYESFFESWSQCPVLVLDTASDDPRKPATIDLVIRFIETVGG
jgi:deoxyadenosine/deoxycytidine kinase